MIGEEKRARDIVWSEIMGFLRGVNRNCDNGVGLEDVGKLHLIVAIVEEIGRILRKVDGSWNN